MRPDEHSYELTVGDGDWGIRSDSSLHLKESNESRCDTQYFRYWENPDAERIGPEQAEAEVKYMVHALNVHHAMVDALCHIRDTCEIAHTFKNIDKALESIAYEVKAALDVVDPDKK